MLAKTKKKCFKFRPADHPFPMTPFVCFFPSNFDMGIFVRPINFVKIWEISEFWNRNFKFESEADIWNTRWWCQHYTRITWCLEPWNNETRKNTKFEVYHLPVTDCIVYLSVSCMHALFVAIVEILPYAETSISLWPFDCARGVATAAACVFVRCVPIGRNHTWLCLRDCFVMSLTTETSHVLRFGCSTYIKQVFVTALQLRVEPCKTGKNHSTGEIVQTNVP